VFRFAAAFLFSLTAFAQSIQVLSDSNQVLVGRSLSFRAVIRDAQGRPVNGSVTWSSTNPAVASIDAGGTLTARTLGALRVQARSGNLLGETVVQTIPGKVEISPDRATIEVGKQQRFAATAYDADGRVINGVGFTWSLLNRRLGTSQVARVDATGMVTGVSEGGAMVLGTYTYADIQTGLQRQWLVTAPVDVNVPVSYELRRLYSRDRQREQRFEVRAKPTMLWPAEDGVLLFNASLGGVANALAALDVNSGSLKPVSIGGETRFAQGSHTVEYRTHAVTRSGRILSYEDTNINGAQMNLGDSTGLHNHLSNNTPLLAGTEATSGMFITRNSFNDPGYSLVRANFRYELNNTGYTGLFIGYEGKYFDLLLSTKDAPEGVTGAFSIDGDFGIDGKGTAYYSVTAGTNRIFYRHAQGEQRRRWIGVGDAILGSTVRSFAGGRGNSPAFWVDEDGTVALAVVLNNNNTYFLRWQPDGKMESLQVNSQSGILWHHPAHGTLIHANAFSNRGNGAWLWPPIGDAKPLLRYTDRVDGEVVQDIESGAMSGRGEYYLYIRGDKSNMMFVQVGLDPPRVILRSGDEKDFDAPVNIINLIGGARVGPPHVYAGGSSGSLVEMSPRGQRTLLKYGERLWGNNTMWFGAFHGGTWNVRKSPSGTIYFTTGAGIGKIDENGQPELAVRFPLRSGTLTVNAPGTVDVNAKGDMLFTSSTSAGDSRFFLLPQGATEPRDLLTYSATAATATALDGGIASGYDSFAFGDDGRILASLRFRNLGVPVLYAYDGGAWKQLALPNETRVGPHQITGIANLHRAGGGRLYAGLNIPNGTILCEWLADRWEIIVNNSSIMPSGQVANTVVTQDTNRNGDLLFQHSNGGNNFLVVRRGDKLHQVINLFRPTAEGDYLIRINSIDFRDDGTVYFLASTAADDLVLYEARPLF
jgi:hypothetical protein